MWTRYVCVAYLYDFLRGRHDRDHKIVGFTNTYAISAYHHWCYKFKSRSERGVRHHMIKFVSDLQQVGGFMKSVHITTDSLNLTPAQGEVLSMQHYFISLSVACGYVSFHHQWNLPPRYNPNVVEGGVKHHQTNKQTKKAFSWLEFATIQTYRYFSFDLSLIIFKSH